LVKVPDVEDNDGDMAFAAEGKSGGVHDLEAIGDGLLVGEARVEFGLGVFAGIIGVDTIDIGGFEDEIAIGFASTEGGGGVGGEEGAANAGGVNDNTVFVEMVEGTAAEIGFGNGPHFDSGHHAGGNIALFEGVLEGEAVDDGGEHAHIVGDGLVNLVALGELAAEDIATANDNGELDAVVVDDFDEILSDLVVGRERDAVIFSVPEEFAAEFEEDAVIFERREGRHGKNDQELNFKLQTNLKFQYATYK
jgi:hypothetical protein